MSMSSTSKLIAGFVALIIGIVLVAQVADIGLEVTAKSNTVDELHTVDGTDINTGWDGAAINETTTYTITNTPTSWKVDDCPITDFVLSNSTDTFADTTDYILTASEGTYTLVDSVTAVALLGGTPNNQTFVSYTYCGDDYMNVGWGATVINLVPGFFALALLLISIAIFYDIAKENGIIN